MGPAAHDVAGMERLCEAIGEFRAMPRGLARAMKFSSRNQRRPSCLARYRFNTNSGCIILMPCGGTLPKSSVNPSRSSAGQASALALPPPRRKSFKVLSARLLPSEDDCRLLRGTAMSLTHQRMYKDNIARRKHVSQFTGSNQQNLRSLRLPASLSFAQRINPCEQMAVASRLG